MQVCSRRLSGVFSTEHRPAPPPPRARARWRFMVRRRGGRCWLLFCADTVAHVHGCMLSHLRHKIDSISCLTRVLGGLEGAMHCPNSALNVGMRGMCVGHGSVTAASPPPAGAAPGRVYSAAMVARSRDAAVRCGKISICVSADFSRVRAPVRVLLSVSS